MKQLIRKSHIATPASACIVLATALLLLASCTQDDNLPGGTAADSRPALLGLSNLRAADISTVDVSTRAADTREATTRAAASTPDYPKNQSIGFFVKEDNTHGYPACNNRKGTYNTTRKLWLPTSDSIWLNNHDADIVIYAPYDAAQATAAALNLTACLRPADGSKDIWCKRFPANNQSKDLTATLEHLYTRLCITVTLAADYKAEAKLTDIALTGKDIYAGTTYKPFEAVPYIYDGEKGVSLTPEAAKVLNTTTTSATYDLLLIPTAAGAALTDDLTLTLTVDGKMMRVKIAKEKFTGTKLEAGKQHNINLKLMPGKLALSSVSVVKWDALAEVDGGQAEFEEYYQLEMKSPVKIGKYYYATTNLRYDNNTYSFEDYPWNSARLQFNGGKITHSYWRFGALYPGEQTYQTDQTKLWGEVTGNSNLGDPCKKMGNNWQVPSKAMIENLVDEEQIPEEGSGIYINKKLYFFDNDYGWIKNSELAGIIRVDKKSRKAILLPAAGATGDTSIMYEVGTRVHYWSNTPVPVVEASNNFYFLSKYGSDTSLIVDKVTPVKGHPLRCAYVTP